MGDVLPFKRAGKSQRAEGRTLCDSGFHKWVVVASDPFDSRRGRLVTRYRCTRCQREKSEAR